MRRKNQSIFWGIVLVVLGFFFLVQNFNLLGGVGDVLGGMVFGVLGLLGLGFYFQNRHHWWLAIPSFVFIGLGISSFVNVIPFIREFSGSIFLLSLAAGFWVVYLHRPVAWWALIPAGVLTTIAVVDAIQQFTPRGTDTIMMLGLAATFWFLWTRRAHTRAYWAKWPAIGLVIFALLDFVPLAGKLIFPAILILIGAGILWRNYQRQQIGSSSNITILPPEE